jgi:hypothetical protein
MSAPSSSSSASSSEGEEMKGNLVFGADFEYRDVQIVKDAMSVANEFIAGELFIAALLASLIPLADSAEDHPDRLLSRAGIVAELTRRLLDSAERARLTAHIRSIVSNTHPRLVRGATPSLMETRLAADGPRIMINVDWVKSLKENTFAGAADSRARELYLSYHSTMLITKLIHEFCHAITHFLVEFVWTMDMSSPREAAAAAAPSTTSTSSTSSTSPQQEGVESSPVSPQLEGLSWPKFKKHLRHTPPKMGTQLVTEPTRHGTLSTTKKRCVLEGDFGYWIEELLFGFRINCLPPPPHKLVTLIGTRTLPNGEQVHYTITSSGHALITADALSAAARDSNPSLTSLRLTHAGGHVEPTSMVTEGAVEEERPTKVRRLKSAGMAQSDLSTSLPYTPTEEQEPSDDDEGEGWSVVKH